MRDLRARLEEMETAQRRGVGAAEFSDPEIEEEDGHAEEEVTTEDASTERLIRAISRMSSKTKMDIPVYEGSLNAEELLDWIRALDTYFDYEDVEEDKKVRHAVTKLKGHVALSVSSSSSSASSLIHLPNSSLVTLIPLLFPPLSTRSAPNYHLSNPQHAKRRAFNFLATIAKP
jgi:hypothetical protein